MWLDPGHTLVLNRSLNPRQVDTGDFLVDSLDLVMNLKFEFPNFQLSFEPVDFQMRAL